MNVEFGTDPERPIGFYFNLKDGDITFWGQWLQVEIYLWPKDWTFKLYREFGLLSLGPIAFNWSDSE